MSWRGREGHVSFTSPRWQDAPSLAIDPRPGRTSSRAEACASPSLEFLIGPCIGADWPKPGVRSVLRTGWKDADVHDLVTLRRPIGRTSRRKLVMSATSTGGRQR